MTLFSENEIKGTPELAAELIKDSRLRRKLSLEEASQSLSISIAYLEAIEKGEFYKLPKGAYGRHFIREYARWLKLDPAGILEALDKENVHEQAARQRDLFAAKVTPRLSFLAIPSMLRSLFLVISVILVIVYIGWYINRLLQPPFLQLNNPSENARVKSSSLEISGQSDPEASIRINGQSVLPNQQGFFSMRINLKPGLNEIDVRSQKKYGAESKLERKVIFDKE